MKRAVIYLPRFSLPAERVASVLGADLIAYSPTAFQETVPHYPQIAAVMSMGIAVRGIAPHLHDKWTDPVLVLVTPDLRLAIPVTGGHHGANEMARELASLGAVPVITTATERAGVPSVEGIAASEGCVLVNCAAAKPVNAAFLDGTAGVYAVAGPCVIIAGRDTAILLADGTYSVGIGCRKGAPARDIEAAVQSALAAAGISSRDVYVYATTAKKLHESGILEAVRALGGALLCLDDQTLGMHPPQSPSRASQIGLSGVAEPCALAASKRKELVLEKTVNGGVTVAIAR
jgi:cobalt-precorrin 5A hydrolase